MKLLEALANVATVVVAGAVLYVVWPSGDRNTVARAGEPVAQPDLVGMQVPYLTVASAQGASPDTLSLSGHSTVIYLFATTCMFCEAQKSLMGEFLSQLGGSVQVLTASREAAEVLTGYWGGAALAIASLTEESGRALRVGAVPAVLVLGSDAIVKQAYVGSMLAWNKERFSREVLGALGATPFPSEDPTAGRSVH